LGRSLCHHRPSQWPKIDHRNYPSVRYEQIGSEGFHAFVTAHKREHETMEATLRRLIGGPHPEDVAGILSSETATLMRDRLEDTHDMDVEGNAELRERFKNEVNDHGHDWK